ncbi:hypothetical protein FRC03_003668 [Tulasnella sp. 419]|nr:hypothetical protein FRC03_003668 [Tulasnella sp. 419]
MLAHHPQPTQRSRPRPPAQVRRATSKTQLEFDPTAINSDITSSSSPPPPYVDGSSSPVSNRRIVETVTTTTTSTRTTVMEGNDVVRQFEEAVPFNPNSMGSEELTELLKTAKAVIQNREHDFLRVSEESRRLLEQNQAMTAQWEQLFNRIPMSPSRTLKHMHSDSSWSISDVGSRPGSPLKSFATPRRKDHSRRVSLTHSPSLMADLNEQNDKLRLLVENLEAETNAAKTGGDREFRRLKKEIEELQSELGRSHDVNKELENRLKEEIEKHKARDAEEMERRKQERIEEIRALRNSGKQKDDSEPVKDFAPSSSLSSVASLTSPRRSRTRTYDHSDEDSLPTFQLALSTIMSANESTYTPTPSAPPTLGPSAGETVLVAKLLAKIEELEEANRMHRQKQEQLGVKLTLASKEAQNMRSVYDDLEAEVRQAEINGDFAEDELDDEEWKDEGDINGTLRLLRESLIPDDSPRPTLRLGPRTSSVARNRSSSRPSTPRSTRTPRSSRGTGNRRVSGKKSRKPLSKHLFVSPPSSPSASGSPSTKPGSSRTIPQKDLLAPPSRHSARLHAISSPSRPTSPDGRLSPNVAPYSALLDDISPRSSLRNASSLGSLGNYVGGGLGLEDIDYRRSLESELASEFGPDWAEDAANSVNILEDSFGDARSYMDNSFASAQEGDEEGIQVNPAIAALNVALDPSNSGRPLEYDEHILPVGCLRSSPADTFYHLNRAVQARPARWIDIRSQRLLTEGPSSGVPATSPPLITLNPEPHSKEGQEDPWESNMYLPEVDQPEESTALIRYGQDDKGKSREKHLERREAVLARLNNAMLARRRRPSFGSDASGDEYEVVGSGNQAAEYYTEDDGKYDPKALAKRLQRTSLDGFLEIWLFLEFVGIILVFVVTAFWQGPRKVMGENNAAQRRIRRK